MVTKEHTEHLKALHRAVYNDWGLSGFVQMLTYKCVLAGKELVVLDERETSKTCSGCGNKQDNAAVEAHVSLWDLWARAGP
jgi:putative transposase